MSYHTIRRLGSYSITLPDDNTPNYNNESLLFTFARPLITNTANFSLLRSRASSSDYTESLWDGDVKLVVYISGLYTGCEYKVRCQRNGCGSINRGGGGGGGRWAGGLAHPVYVLHSTMIHSYRSVWITKATGYCSTSFPHSLGVLLFF